VGRGGALPGWAWRVRACDVMALPRKGPDIFAMMPGHACRTSSREHGDNRLTARHARRRVWGRLQGVEWLPWAKLQAAVLAPDGAAAAPLSLSSGWAVAAHCTHCTHCTGRTCLPNQSPRTHGHHATTPQRGRDEASEQQPALFFSIPGSPALRSAYAMPHYYPYVSCHGQMRITTSMCPWPASLHGRGPSHAHTLLAASPMPCPASL
jgi:hypothetical protein